MTGFPIGDRDVTGAITCQHFRHFRHLGPAISFSAAEGPGSAKADPRYPVPITVGIGCYSVQYSVFYCILLYSTVFRGSQKVVLLVSPEDHFFVYSASRFQPLAFPWAVQKRLFEHVPVAPRTVHGVLCTPS